MDWNILIVSERMLKQSEIVSVFPSLFQLNLGGQWQVRRRTSFPQHVPFHSTFFHCKCSPTCEKMISWRQKSLLQEKRQGTEFRVCLDQSPKGLINQSETVSWHEF